MEDSGFALLTGRSKSLSASLVCQRVKKLSKETIKKIYEWSQPLSEFIASSLWVSIDEHVVARWTAKVKIAKTKHPTRGRAMRADKLFYVYELAKARLLSLHVGSGAIGLWKLLTKMIRELIKVYSTDKIRVIFDRGGYKGSTFAKLNHMKGVIYLARAKNYPTNVAQWNKITELRPYIPPRDRKLPPEKQRQWFLGECFTKIKGCMDRIPSILIVDPTKEGSKRYCTLFTKDLETSREALADEYLLRFRHENCYRVMVHDLHLDAMPKSYSVDPKDLEKPNFLQKRLFLIAWLKAVSFNVVGQFKGELPGIYSRMQVGTIVRKFLARPAVLRITSDELWVILDSFKEQDILRVYCQNLNQRNLRIPWLGNRLLRIEFANKSLFTKPKEIRNLLSVAKMAN